MGKPVEQRPSADADTDSIWDWLQAKSPPAADKFLDAIEHVYALLGEHPAIGSTRHADLFPDMPVPVRFHPVRDFPRILIYYIDRPDIVEIIRVWDAAQGLQELIETTD
jgi:toxin ParE1/3/4